MSDMLNVKGLSISFGGLKAVNNFAINIEKGQLYGLIGPNGAGKTTIFNLLTGVYKPDTGTILLDGQSKSPIPSPSRCLPKQPGIQGLKVPIS